MCDNNCIARAVVQINNAQVSVAQPIKASPFPGHRFDARHRVRVLRELLQFGFELGFDSRVHSFEIARGAAVNDNLRHVMSLTAAEKLRTCAAASRGV